MAIDQNELRRKALLDQMGGPDAPVPGASGSMQQSTPGLDLGALSGTGGVAGGTGAAPGPEPQPAGGAPAAPDYTKRGQYGTFNAGSDKYARPWDDMSERYKMQTVLSNFDPNAGITPEVLAALNGANIGGAQFSGSRDKLDARGLQQWEGYDGQEGIGDIIQGFNDPNNKNKSWGAWQPEGAADAPQGGGAAAGQMPGDVAMQALGQVPKFGGQAIDPRLQGDPLQAILQALGQMSGGAPNQQALLQQLRG